MPLVGRAPGGPEALQVLVLVGEVDARIVDQRERDPGDVRAGSRLDGGGQVVDVAEQPLVLLVDHGRADADMT